MQFLCFSKKLKILSKHLFFHGCYRLMCTSRRSAAAAARGQSGGFGGRGGKEGGRARGHVGRRCGRRASQRQRQWQCQCQQVGCSYVPRSAVGFVCATAGSIVARQGRLRPRCVGSRAERSASYGRARGVGVGATAGACDGRANHARYVGCRCRIFVLLECCDVWIL